MHCITTALLVLDLTWFRAELSLQFEILSAGMPYFLFYTYAGCGQALVVVKIARLQDKVTAARQPPG